VSKVPHALAACWFMALACLLTYPLVRELSSAIPGTGAGDNVGFLWNLWWFRTVRQSADLQYLQCPYLFAPFGTSLVLHTAAPLQSILGATLLARLPLVTTYNLLLLSALAANGIAAYALALYQTRHPLAAVLAGTLMATSSYIAIHLLGHANLVNAWVLPLGALAWIAFLAAPSTRRAVMAAVAFAATACSDYYYLIYLGVFAAIWWFAQSRSITVQWREPRYRVAERTVLSLVIVLVLFTAAIAVTGGFDVRIAGLHATAFSLRNPLTGIWLLGLCWLLLRLRLGIDRNAGRASAPTRRVLTLVGAAGGVFLLLISPIVVEAVRVVSSGDYVSQRYLWRSGPRGIDLLTLVTGNPLNAVYGGVTRSLFDRFHINLMEQTAWIGLAPLVIGLMTLVGGLRPRTTMTRAWTAIGVVFLIWSAGPFIVIGGTDTGVLLPQLFARYVPIVANARIPGRAFIVAQLAVAVLCALAVTRVRLSRIGVLSLCALAVADGIAVPYPMYLVKSAGQIDRTLAQDPTPGSVLELPIGLLDGFGQTGRFDFRAMEHQIAHGRPIVGGAISRITPRITRAYGEWSAVAALMDASSDPSPDQLAALPTTLGSDLAQRGVRYVVVNTDAVAISRGTLVRRGLRFVEADGSRELYRVAGR
jgi:hypothetical protein